MHDSSESSKATLREALLLIFSTTRIVSKITPLFRRAISKAVALISLLAKFRVISKLTGGSEGAGKALTI